MKLTYDLASRKTVLRDLFASRAAAWLVVGAVAVVLLFKVALPMFVSTPAVKLNMERALSAWAGARASIVGEPDISFWPHPVLTLHTVRFEGGDSAAPERLAEADAVSAGFDVLAAVRGTPVFYDFHLLNPVFKVERRIDGSLNWRRPDWMRVAIADAASPVRNTPIGDISIENGTVELVDRITATIHRITNVAGSIQWPRPAARLSASISAVMNGERVEGSIVCDEPMALLAGHDSPIRTSFTSAPLTFSFDGAANGSSRPFARGHLQVAASSIPAMMAWYAAATPPFASAGSITIDTNVTASPQTMKMDNLSLSVDGANATGVLDIAWHGQDGPHIDGTLAFDRVDLATLLSSLLPAHAKSDPAVGTPDMAFLKQISLDLRLSAREASYGPIALTDVAAGVMAENGRASADIGDSTYFGGSLSGRIALANDGTDGGTLQFSLKDADLDAVVANLGLQGPLPLGRGVLSIDLSTSQPLSAMTMAGVSGEVHYTASDGRLTNFDALEFERLAAQGDFFNITQARNGSFAFIDTEIAAKLRRGVAELTKADIRGEERTLSLAGIIPFRNGSLALAGAIRPNDSTQAAARFFIGGSWPNPVISPLSAIPASP